MLEVEDTSNDEIVEVPDPLLAVKANQEICVINPNDQVYLDFLAKQLIREDMCSFWEDRMRSNPRALFTSLFMNPDHAIGFDIGNGHGVLAFLKQLPGHRAFMFGAAWGERAKHCPQVRRRATAAAMLALEFEVMEGITSASNTAAIGAMEAANMRYGGRIPKGLWYNGVQTDGVWYELSRKDLELPPL